MTVAELVRMANQIAAFNAAYPRDEAIRGDRGAYPCLLGAADAPHDGPNISPPAARG
ncbi:MAG: hypothetical protein KatS3mg118_0195 [Paracoccaceae bacterium]|nr:MAG: hypothetical protein KatS3mg118_0195 [Paracoccaceae bacterium]